MEMTYAACILWTLLLAVWSAVDDADQIAAGERLNKALQWCIRAFGVTAFCVACGLWWMALPMGALFSSVFRFDLNRRRGLDWRYVAPWSSLYDRVMFTIANQWYPEKAWAALLCSGYHRGYSEATKQVHRAGLLAYIAEAVMIVGAVLIFA